MSFSIPSSDANPYGMPAAQKSASNLQSQQAHQTPLRRAEFSPFKDPIRFGRHAEKPDDSFETQKAKPPSAAKKAADKTPETKPTDKSTADQSKGAKASTTTNANYGHRENNIREGARILLCDIAPLALSVLPLVGIPGLGFVFALATLPMSYLSGKLGRRIAKDVNPEDLNPAFKYIHQVKAALTSAHTGKDGSVVDNINKATDDLLNIRNMPAIVSTKLLPLLKVNPEGGAAKFLGKINGMAVMRAEVNIRLAQAENKKDAGKAMFAGVKDFAIYSGMSKLGKALSVSSIPGAKWAGTFLENAAWIKIAADLMKTKAESKPTKEQVPS